MKQSPEFTPNGAKNKKHADSADGNVLLLREVRGERSTVVSGKATQHVKP